MTYDEILFMLQFIPAFVIGWFIAFGSWYLIPQDKGICASGKISNAEFLANVSTKLEGECYFSENYDAATAQIVRLSKELGAEVIELSVGEGLTTHVSIIQGNPERFLLHMSGVHGVEAYAGSSVQGAALDYLKVSGNVVNGKFVNASFPTIVIVHAVNPYGFKYNRRVNEENVDINRNFLTDEQWEFVRKRNPNYASYVDFDGVLNQLTKPTPYIYLNEIFALYDMLQAVLKHGTGSLKRSMVSGNYHKQQGFGFGGFARSKSVNNLIDLIVQRLQIPQVAKQVVMIDVHSGLGPTGVDTLFISPNDVDIESIFPTEKHPLSGKEIGGLKTGKNNQDADAVGQGYELTMGMSDHFCELMIAPQLTGTNRLCISQVRPVCTQYCRLCV